MKFRRIAGAASVVAMLFLATIGAGAAIAAPPSVVINSPGVDVSYEAYPAISGSITQEGAQPELTSASVALSSNDGWSSENSTQSWPGGSIFSGGGASITYNWTPKPKYNGRYTVTVTGSGRSGGFGGQTVQTNIVTRSFNIAIDPVKPTGVAAGMDDAGRVTISWQANPEPDIAGYQLYRSYQNGNPGKVGDPIPASSKPTATDNLSGKPTGAYKYAVEAIRRARTCASSSTDPVCKEGLTGPLSSYSAAVTVRGAGATTTTSTTIKKNPGTGGG
ncbi:MAG: hypothetical protein Q8K63_12250, partial [Acidimicrobiales bacterium]|nr:hypothetical protein [Acidimicrobiales bacterium]